MVGAPRDRCGGGEVLYDSLENMACLRAEIKGGLQGTSISVKLTFLQVRKQVAEWRLN